MYSLQSSPLPVGFEVEQPTLHSSPIRRWARTRPLAQIAALLTMHLSSSGNIAEPPAGQAVELPPFVVTHVVEGPAWRVASIPGFEILTQCSDRETREIAAALWRGPQLTLPPALRPQRTVPTVVVVFDQVPYQAEHPGTLGSSRYPGEINRHWTNVIKRSVDDRESFAVNLFKSSFDYTPIFRFDARTLLRYRVPSAPAWLNEGLFGGYGVHREGVYWDQDLGRRRIHVAAWCSAEELAKANEMPLSEAEYFLSQKPGLRPRSVASTFVFDLAQLFVEPAPKIGDQMLPRWASTAALFVSWGAFAPSAERRDAFWRFAEMACAQPVTEEMFNECFGASYAEIQGELGWYLSVASRKEMSVPVSVTDCPKIQFRDASRADFARLYGEWQRIEGRALAAQFPELAKRYREAAVSTLEKAYVNPETPRDPRILASLGLLALDSGKFELARNLLAQASENKAEGPAVFLALARLDWANWMTDDQGTLKDGDRDRVLSLLLKAEQQQPQLFDVYSHLAQLAATNNAIQPAHREALMRGLKNFPKNGALVSRIRSALAQQSSSP